MKKKTLGKEQCLLGACPWTTGLMATALLFQGPIAAQSQPPPPTVTDSNLAVRTAVSGLSQLRIGSLHQPQK